MDFLFLCIFVIFVGALWTSSAPEFGDTYLYHAQAIRWIEEYGTVKGLGNLHNRFAYNSAFMVLQALFSFRWLYGQSLHSLNGFVCVFFSVYGILSINLKNKKSMSYWLKIAIVLYAFMNRNYFSSPTSDMMPLLLLLWINIKWIEMVENKVEDIIPYIYLVIIGIYAVTLKLTVGGCILLAVFLLVYLVRKKNWKYIGMTSMLCIVVAFPFLARNVLISGYILYPYHNIDIFNVDWKMPSSLVECDSRTITVWGRGINNVNSYSDSVLQWFPTWFNSEGLFYQIIFIFGVISMAGVIIFCVYSIYKGKNFLLRILFWSDAAGFLLWFFGAPLIRYGIVYLFAFPCILCGMMKYSNKLFKPIYYLFLPLYLIMCLATIDERSKISILVEHDYEKRSYYIVNKYDTNFYIPSNGEIGYHAFPSTPYENQLNIIEMRGKSLKDGFRIREEYENKHINSDGLEW